MKNKILKISLIFLLMIVIFNGLKNNVFATSTEIEIEEKFEVADKKEEEKEITIDNIIDQGNNFLNKGKGNPISDAEMKNLSDTIYNFLLAIGMVIAVVVGTILGIKFMISTIDERAKIKQTIVAYVIGCVVLFGAFGIWKIVITIFNQI